MVELVKAGRSPEELAREFEPTAQSIKNWVAQAARDTGQGDGGLTTAELEELSRLRRENRQLRGSASKCVVARKAPHATGFHGDRGAAFIDRMNNKEVW